MDERYAEWMSRAAEVVGCAPEELVGRLTNTSDAGLAIHPLYTVADELPELRPSFGGRSDVLACQEVEPGRTVLAPDGVDVAWLRGPVDCVPDELADVAVFLLDAGSTVAVPDPYRHRFVTDPFADPASCDEVLGELADRIAVGGDEVLRVVADGSRVHDRGGGAVEEIAVTAAGLVSALRVLDAHGVSGRAALPHLLLRVAVTDDQFESIAKLRALRSVVASIAAAVGASGTGVTIHAVTSAPMMSAVDPFVNIARTAVAGFAAIVGGADLVTVRPFDHPMADPVAGLPRSGADRIARMTIPVLLAEAGLSAVADASGGSWYVEAHTYDLARAAWSTFQRIESAGGAAAALAPGGIVDALVEVSVARRHAALDDGSRIVTAVTSFRDGASAGRTRDVGASRWSASLEVPA